MVILFMIRLTTLHQKLESIQYHAEIRNSSWEKLFNGDVV